MSLLADKKCGEKKPEEKNSNKNCKRNSKRRKSVKATEKINVDTKILEAVNYLTTRDLNNHCPLPDLSAIENESGNGAHISNSAFIDLFENLDIHKLRGIVRKKNEASVSKLKTDTSSEDLVNKNKVSEFFNSYLNETTSKKVEQNDERNLNAAVTSVTDIEQQLFMLYTTDGIHSLDKNKASVCDNVNKLKNKEGNCRKEKTPKKERMRKKETFKSDNIIYESKMFENSDLKPKSDSQVTTKNGCKNSKDDASNSNKENKIKDTKFPQYLNEKEMDIVSKYGLLMVGFIRINKKNFTEAYISAPDNGMDILINGLLDRNRALDGDEVYFILKGEDEFRTNADNEIQRTGIVVGLKKLIHNRYAIGVLNRTGPCTFMLLPRDLRIPKIKLKKSKCTEFLMNPDSYKDKIYLARIKNWVHLNFADGVIIKEIGDVANIEAETEAILLSLDLNTEAYSESLRRYFPKIPYVISEAELENRLDCRTECIFTIDPATAKDLDDAVSCKVLEGGLLQIGVHISDVTYFLKHDNKLDKQVAQRATSIYLVQQVYHMLPRELCELCSLTPGEDKFAFSVFWIMSPDGKIISHNFSRTVINSCGKFSYEQVQDVLNNKDVSNFPQIFGGHTVDTIVETIVNLNKIAVKLREKRFDNGALKIDQTKLMFSLDESGMPEKYSVYVNKESHRLIEEFMLLANITVAERIMSYYPKLAFLRSHREPSSYMLKRLQKQMINYGVDLDISSSKSLHLSLLKYNGSDLESRAKLMVLNNALTKPMQRARYYCAQFSPEKQDQRHYALSVPLYTHFTSPIRRYADVMVHRFLAASLGYCALPAIKSEKVKEIAENCNKQKYSAKLAGEKSTEFFLSLYIMNNSPLVYDAVVCDIKDRSFDCIILDNGSQQRIYFQDLPGESNVSIHDGVSRLTIHWPEGVQEIGLFSIIKIELSTSDKKIKSRLLPSI